MWERYGPAAASPVPCTNAYDAPLFRSDEAPFTPGTLHFSTGTYVFPYTAGNTLYGCVFPLYLRKKTGALRGSQMQTIPLRPPLQNRHTFTLYIAHKSAYTTYMPGYSKCTGKNTGALCWRYRYIPLASIAQGLHTGFTLGYRTQIQNAISGECPG